MVFGEVRFLRFAGFQKIGMGRRVFFCGAERKWRGGKLGYCIFLGGAWEEMLRCGTTAVKGDCYGLSCLLSVGKLMRITHGFYFVTIHLAPSSIGNTWLNRTENKSRGSPAIVNGRTRHYRFQH